MIQRIQSIYLLLAAILMAVTAFSPILVLTEGLTLYSCGISSLESEIVKPTWGIVSMALLSAILAFATIFFYKNRKKQMKMVSITVGVVLFYFITAAVYLVSYVENVIQKIQMVDYGLFLPILALVFLFLAKRGINKDEKLVRSTERIR